MRADGWIKRDVSVQERLTEIGDEVTAHGDQQAGEREHHPAGGPAGHRHAVPRDLTQTPMLTLNWVVWNGDIMSCEWL